MSKNNSSANNSKSSYTVTSSGTNDAGNHYCHRDPGPEASNQNSYHYSNTQVARSVYSETC